MEGEGTGSSFFSTDLLDLRGEQQRYGVSVVRSELHLVSCLVTEIFY